MSKLRDSYQRITFNNGTKSVQEKANKYGAIKRMINTWAVPANASVYLSALTPPESAGRGALLGRSIETITSGGIKYQVWLSASSIVYDASPDPVFVSPDSETIWRKVTSADTTGATLTDEFWLPDGSNVGGGSGSFEEIQEVRSQPNDTELVIQITNLDLVNSHDVLLQLTYIEDRDGLILYPGGM